jgi:hypothetical protein
LNQTEYVQHHCGVVNTEDNARKLRNALQLSQSMAKIWNEQSIDTAKKKTNKQLEYRALAPVNLSRLKTKNGELNKITKKEILSIMFSVFLVLDDDNMKKNFLMDAFMKCYGMSQTKIPVRVWRTTTTSQATPVATSATSTAPAAR